MKIVSIDPGITTGLAIRTREGNIITEAVHSVKHIWNILTSEDKPDVVIYECFNASGQISKYGVRTIEIVGGIIALCSVFGIASVAQAPYRRKPYEKAARDILKLKKHLDHEVDALAHLLAFEERNGNTQDLCDTA